MIGDQQLSFVVQGPVNSSPRGTKRVIESIRKYFPASAVVLSTWEGSDVRDLSELVDCVILSDDPGGFSGGRSHLNVNRQIVSSRAGLAAVKTEYAVKIRTDIAVTGRGILQQFVSARMKWKRHRPRAFQDWVVCVNVTTWAGLPLAICDWIYIGRTEDLRRIFDIDFFPREYYMFHSPPLQNALTGTAIEQRYSAEQWLTMKSMTRAYGINERNFEGYWLDTGDFIKRINQEILANEFFRNYDGAFKYKGLEIPEVENVMEKRTDSTDVGE